MTAPATDAATFRTIGTALQALARQSVSVNRRASFLSLQRCRFMTGPMPRGSRLHLWRAARTSWRTRQGRQK
jgi:hypothetical protein